MKVLEVYKDVWPPVRGGIERYIHDLGLFLTSRGHRVSVLTASRSPGFSARTTTVEGMTVTEAPCLCRILSNPVCPGLGRAISGAGQDVTHFHHPLPAATLSWYFGRRTVPHVVTYHSDIVRQAALVPFLGPFIREFLGKASSVLATSPPYVESSPFLRGLGNVRVVPPGVDTGFFTPGGGEPGDYFLFVGRFRSYKGIPVLLEAWSLLGGQRLVMVGGGPLEGAVRKRIAAGRLDVELAGEVDDERLRSLYRGARAFILPSTARSEAYGMVQLEAMACGTPVISTSLATGVPWVNRHMESGIVVPPGDPAALAGAVTAMLDDELRARLARGALERCLSEFGQARSFSMVEEALRDAAGV
ncbi:glycosyltransferase [Candidatus Fermentibacteria bacterium]|nr:glycosyltransferase [Candidatus Fermentibacteria bacterium]